ncbi:hypothetical protein QIL54_gp1 [ssRNA phage Esthiorhiza.2_6]|uniref:Uncharacterized protein n=1 Tax=ssRNA phage Esthiorhiza.2_6 TaxID=2786073 RepID=A0A8S5L360_9VIRU|nr:hypothetical protein QIL54_gp1 [ssRNA phage Esthiorhiza.2_6]DAD51939.1 TPA_asm: hypothetical protein [ssRNA phage Esthiorhiza.2_6]
MELLPEEVRQFSKLPNGRTYYDYRSDLSFPGLGAI